MIDMYYKDFLEKIITLLKSQIQGEVELRCNKYASMTRYDILVKFKSTNIQIALDCQLGGDVWGVYALCKTHPSKADRLIEQCVKDMVNCLKDNVLKIFFKN